MPLVPAPRWDQFLAAHPQAHLLQTSAWGDLKAAFGWRVVRICNADTGAQVLFKPLPLGLSVAYVPRGPVGANWPGLWPELDAVCRAHGAVFLKVEPDDWEPKSEALKQAMAGFGPQSVPIQPRRTLLIKLGGSEEDWLSQMKQKTRYNIHLAARKGVQVRQSEDVAAFYALMQTTGQRDRFAVHSQAYYQAAYDRFAQQENCALLVAEFEGQPLAGLMVFASGSRAWYLYGASNNLERNRMPAYLLQWEAMRWAAGRGCRTYDLWGIPDEDPETLESQFEQRSDGLWGVYRFKRGFGGQVCRQVGAWDRVYSPFLYGLYLRSAGRREGGND